MTVFEQGLEKSLLILMHGRIDNGLTYFFRTTENSSGIQHI